MRLRTDFHDYTLEKGNTFRRFVPLAFKSDYPLRRPHMTTGLNCELWKSVRK